MRSHPESKQRRLRLRARPWHLALAIALGLAGLGVARVLPSWAFSDLATHRGAARVDLRSPLRGADENEATAVLAWTPAVDAAEYVVFVSKSPLDGLDVEAILARSDVVQRRTTATSMRLQGILRGGPGTTTYSWAVASRDARSGRLVLSDVSSFRASKSFHGGAQPAPLIRQVARGRVAVEPYADGGSILIGNRYRFDPLRDRTLGLVPSLKAAPLAKGEKGSFLVQLRGPVSDAWRDALESAGARVYAYLPNYAFLVRMQPEKQPAIEALPFVRWVGPYLPAFKQSGQQKMRQTSGPGTLVVLLFPDADLRAARTSLEALGGSVLEATDSGRNKLLRVAIDMRHAADIAARNDVAWVEPWTQPHLYNATCQWVVQTNLTNNRRVWDMGLHGEGQVVHTSDSGIRTSHNAFRDAAVPITTFGDYPTHRKIIAYQPAVLGAGILFGDTAGASNHGTHTAGTIVGDDSPFAADLRDGMALKAKIYFQDGGASSNSIITPGDLNLLFQPPYDGNAGGAARISSNSWGSDVAGVYDVMAMAADQFLWDHRDFLISFSNGNAGAPGSVGSPASSKNSIGSGATLNGTSSGSIASFSSQGPCADGRLKPTICSPGNAIQSANGATDTGYKSLSGTSMSSPSGAGAITLIRQYLTEGWYPTGVKTPANALTPSGALLKAMAISSTDDDMPGHNIPDNVVGWGRIKLDNILYFAGDAARTALVDHTNGIETGEFIDYEINVSDAAVPLKIALCWYDHEGSLSASRQLVNDLDLTVTDPSNNVYRGNVFSLGQSATGGQRDTLNVEECVRRTVPGLGLWKIRVTGNNIPFGAQPFALAISGGVGIDNALVQIDKTTYGRDDIIEVRVEDQNASSPISVSVSSSTESTPETLSISGTNGVFSSTFATTALAASNGDGKLSVSHGDVITVGYSDANPAANLKATAVADLEGPIISNVGATVAPASVNIGWTTNTPASSRVYYGTTPSLGQVSALDTDLVGAHAFVLAGLQADTDYWFDVESADHVGNTTRDDAGGNHYRFTTSRRGDILLVVGDTSFGQASLYANAFANRGWDATVLEADGAAPAVGNKTAGLRSYVAVWWQVGLEQYPPFSDATRDSLTKYFSGGGRFAFCAHDAAWAFGDGTSGFSTAARLAWMESRLHVHFLADPTTWSSNIGLGGDPISGSYTGGIAYTPFRSGGAGDEISSVPSTGTANYVWRNNESSPDNIAVRWANGVNDGSPDSSLWGGTPTRVLANCFEWSQIVSPASREDVLDRSLIWLIGRDHPDVAVTSPNGGEVVSGNTTSISWSETVNGAGVGARSLYYSTDAGSSWQLITASPGASSYSWDVSALPNGATYRVRVVVADDGTPSLRGGDISDANFKVDRAGGDNRGPVVRAGSIQSDPNPMDNHAPSTLQATVTDVGNGDANVAEAEWSEGATPAAAGSGHAMAGSFDAATVDVSATIPVLTIAPGERTFWVRGRDAGGTWGSASQLVIVVNGDQPTAVEPVPMRFALERNMPNPFNPTTVIRFSLPRESDVSLAIYNAKGERVRNLVGARMQAGYKSVVWDGRSDTGRAMTSGIYFYRLEAGDFQTTRKMVLLK